MIDIIQIHPGSIAEELGILPGDKIISLNGHNIKDALDFRFHNSAEFIELLIQRGTEQYIFEIEKDYEDDIGIELEDLQMRSCGNKCIFCFVFQNPKGLRKSLYFKDEDYRFSFLFGHYVTLTNATQADLDRIVEQRLSPLYVSVHVTDPERRKLLLGIKFDDNLLEKFDYLTQNGIELNCQIVLCPELNDGAYLDRTIEDLKAYYPGVRSVAIVPVGLTMHRKNLFPIKPVTHEYSLATMKLIDERRRLLKNELGTSFVYLSDEFYIRTRRQLPDNDYYEGFYQLENGVGLTRDFINRFEEEYSTLPEAPRPLKIGLVTGILGHMALQRYFMDDLNRLPGYQFRLHRIANQFYGPGITVAGLLVGEDIYNGLKNKELGDYIVLPPRCLNDDGKFLDDSTPDELEKKLNKKIIVFPGSFTELLEEIREYETTFSSHHWQT